MGWFNHQLDYLWAFFEQKWEELKLVLLDDVFFMWWYFDLAVSFSEVLKLVFEVLFEYISLGAGSF